MQVELFGLIIIIICSLALLTFIYFKVKQDLSAMLSLFVAVVLGAMVLISLLYESYSAFNINDDKLSSKVSVFYTEAADESNLKSNIETLLKEGLMKGESIDANINIANHLDSKENKVEITARKYIFKKLLYIDGKKELTITKMN